MKGPDLSTMPGTDTTHCALLQFLAIVLLTLSNKNILVSESGLKISSSTEAMKAQGTFVKITFLQQMFKIISSLQHLEESLTVKVNSIPDLHLLTGKQNLNFVHLFLWC